MGNGAQSTLQPSLREQRAGYPSSNFVLSLAKGCFQEHIQPTPHGQEKALGQRGARPCGGNYLYCLHLKYTTSHQQQDRASYDVCLVYDYIHGFVPPPSVQSFDPYISFIACFACPCEVVEMVICILQMRKQKHRNYITFPRSHSQQVNKINENSCPNVA